MSSYTLDVSPYVSTFRFCMSKERHSTVTEIIGYGLATLVNTFFVSGNQSGFGDVFGMDSAKHIMGEQLSNLYECDKEFLAVLDDCSLELYAILASPEGEALEAYIQGSEGFVDCFPIPSTRVLCMAIREGLGENPKGSYCNLLDTVYSYQEFKQILEPTKCPLPPLAQKSSLFDFQNLPF